MVFDNTLIAIILLLGVVAVTVLAGAGPSAWRGFHLLIDLDLFLNYLVLLRHLLVLCFKMFLSVVTFHWGKGLPPDYITVSAQPIYLNTYGYGFLGAICCLVGQFGMAVV